ncbi:hypothetical protein [Sinorhizobium psoraleae]|uniref:hypothetical protein n=1 Tax=Sinorhizobium psoraleae TaxID=520838 RepID=UPI0028A14F8D|nr:hypothetical protein [Sinorhizobium psoraleae]
MAVDGASILDGRCTIHVGDCLDVMRTMPSGSVDCVVTSLHIGAFATGVAGQIGLERDVRRAPRRHGQRVSARYSAFSSRKGRFG